LPKFRAGGRHHRGQGQQGCKDKPNQAIYLEYLQFNPIFAQVRETGAA
jgi:hypothetical protein